MSSTPHPIDVYVGKRLKALRIIRDMIQEDLGKSVGITTQQIQKYEKGHNRISASRLYEFATKLNVEVSYFFAGYCGANANNQHNSNTEKDANAPCVEENNTKKFEYMDIDNKDVIKLITAFHSIEDPEVKKRISALVNILAGSTSKANVEQDS